MSTPALPYGVLHVVTIACHVEYSIQLFLGAASLHIGLPARLPVCPPARLFQLVSGEVSLTILTSTIVSEYCRVFNNYPATRHGKSCNSSADTFC